VSQASDVDAESLIHLLMTIDRRSMAEMQRRVDKQSKRSVVVRYMLAKGDKDKIAAWNQDLVRILHVFNVRSIGFCWESANLVPFQAELSIDTNMRVADTQAMVADTQTMVVDARMTISNTQTTVTNTETMVAETQMTVANTQTMVADTQTTVTSTQTMVADMHRNMLTGQKATSSQNNSVGATCYLQTMECLLSPRLKPGQ
jgi:hypothetical protein